jgi:hypothetical protein
MGKIINISEFLKEINSTHFVGAYHYQSEFNDKIYMSNIENLAIKDLCLNDFSTNFNSELAGDIGDEFRVNNPEAIRAVELELTHHLQKALNLKVGDLSVKDPNKPGYDLWVNYQKQYEFNPSHNHAGEFSFVIYASIPEEIRNEHKNAHGNTKTRGLIQFNSERTSETVLLNPSENNILIFKSDHKHQVYPFYSDLTRISIAGNIHTIWIEE